MKKKKLLKGLILTPCVIAVVFGGLYLYLYRNGLSGKQLVTPAGNGQLRVACVGDSITYGHGVSNWPKNNYPAVLQSLLGEKFHVRNFGVSGRCVQVSADQPYTDLDTYQESLEYGADIVVFMMGSNDAKPENWKGEEAFRASLCELLDSYSGAKILLCTPATAFYTQKNPGPGKTNFDIQPATVELIAAIVREVAQERGYPLLDIHILTAENPQWFRADGVHPDSTGAAAIAGAVRDAVAGLVSAETK